jgi:hypothetical protein
VGEVDSEASQCVGKRHVLERPGELFDLGSDRCRRDRSSGGDCGFETVGGRDGVAQHLGPRCNGFGASECGVAVVAGREELW